MTTEYTIHYQNPAYGLPTKLERTQGVQELYDQHLEALKREGISPAQYLNEFELPHLRLTQNQKAIVTRNLYPYDLPKAYEHLLVWGNILPYQAKQLAFGMFGLENVVAIFTNKSKRQSVKGLKHYHLIICTL